jgi:hypothetical protein
VGPFQVTFDALDPMELAVFWAAALGYGIQSPPPGYESWPEFLKAQGVPEEQWGSGAALVDPQGRGPRIYLQRVSEHKAAKNRMHLDLGAGGGPRVPTDEQRRRVRSEVARLTALGATFVEEHEELGVVWAVLLDPEGNEFCA